jgi:C4-dicarboxylate-specific signal transduction histidine kinase
MDRSTRSFFETVLLITGGCMAANAVIFSFLGAYFSALALLCSLCTWIPLSYFLAGRGFVSEARHLLMFACASTIYFANLGVGQDLGAEYYFLPGSMLSLLLFEPEQPIDFAFSLSIPFATWALFLLTDRPQLTGFWAPPILNAELIRAVDFVGAFIVSIFFLNYYRLYLTRLKIEMSSELQKSKAMESQLNEAQRIAKLGNWEINVAAKTLNASLEFRRMFSLVGSDERHLYLEFRSQFFPEDLKKFEDDLHKLDAQGLSFTSDYRIVHASGESYHFQFCGEPVLGPLHQTGVVRGTAQDVTESNHIMEQLQQQQLKLTTSSKMASLGEMAAGVAHEINNPLAVIHGKTQQLLKKVQRSDVDPVAFEKDLAKINLTVERIAKIIRGLKSFARNAQDDPMENCNLKNNLLEVLDLCLERFKNANVHLSVDAGDELEIECRPSQVGQVILNLINNAFDAIQTLDEKFVHVRLVDLGESVEISVTDSGKGIPKAVVEKMMNPFFTTKQIGQGTGLGLSISLGIIQSHHGVLFYDESEKNTCFKIILPKKQGNAQRTAA